MKKKHLSPNEVELLMEILTVYFIKIKPTSVNYHPASIDAAKKLYKKLQE
jgi:hypothetical protein